MTLSAAELYSRFGKQFLTLLYAIRRGKNPHSFMKLQNALIVAGLMTVSAIAQEPKTATKPPEPPSQQKLSYALGMSLGLQIKHASIDADVDVVARAIKDVLEGKGTEIQEPEIQPLMKQAEAFGRLRQVSKKNQRGRGLSR